MARAAQEVAIGSLLREWSKGGGRLPGKRWLPLRWVYLPARWEVCDQPLRTGKGSKASPPTRLDLSSPPWARRALVQRARRAREAAGEAHALPAAARARRPEPAGAASWAPSPASPGLSTCSGGMELPLGLLLLWALLPPEAHAKEGKSGTHRRSLCLEGWAGTATSLRGRERDLAQAPGAPGTPLSDWGIREGQPGVGGPWPGKAHANLGGSVNEPRYVLPLLHLLLAEAQMARYIQWSKRILPLFPSNTGLADNKFKHKLRKFLPSFGNSPAVSWGSPLRS